MFIYGGFYLRIWVLLIRAVGESHVLSWFNQHFKI